MHLADSISRNLSQGQVGQMRTINPRSFEWANKRKRKKLNTFAPNNTGDPTLNGNLRWWYDISRLTGYANNTAVDGIVAPVTDYSGRGLNLTQTNAVKQPIYYASGCNGLGVLKFDGVNDFMNSISTGAWGTSKITFFIVCGNSAGATIGPGAPFQFSDTWATGGVCNIEFGYNPPNAGPPNYPLSVASNSGPATGGFQINNYYRPVNGSFNVLTTLMDVSNFAGIMNIDGYPASDGSTAGTSGGVLQGGGLYMGCAVRVTTTQYFTGFVAECYGYASLLTEEQIQLNEAYLAEKWGLMDQLNPKNPFRAVV